MGTTSAIGKENPDGTITAIYCNYDGYPKGVGVILRDYYTDPAKIDAMMDQGDMSTIGRNIGIAHSFEERTINECTFYRRDRGERAASLNSQVCPTLNAFAEHEYNYVFTLEGKWEGYQCNLKSLGDPASW